MSSGPSANRLHIGTSGFSYDDWVGPFYPKSIPKGRWFDYYVREFSCVEINATYYSWMAAKAMESLSARAPVGFRFAVKLHRSLTHSKDDTSEGVRATLEQNRPLDEPVLLAQFPNSFIPSEASWQKIEALSSLENLVLEFRNSEWQTEETYERLRGLSISTCMVDAPRIDGLPALVSADTGPISYARFHGRNAAKWYGHEHAFERYNYLYSDQEIAEIADKLTALTEKSKDAFVFFNNHYGAQAVTNARQLAEKLGVTIKPTQTSLFD